MVGTFRFQVPERSSDGCSPVRSFPREVPSSGTDAPTGAFAETFRSTGSRDE